MNRTTKRSTDLTSFHGIHRVIALFAFLGLVGLIGSSCAISPAGTSRLYTPATQERPSQTAYIPPGGKGPIVVVLSDAHGPRSYDPFAVALAKEGYYVVLLDENVLRALLDAISFIQEPDNKTAVLKGLAQWVRLPNPEDALNGYDFMRRMYTRRIYPSLEGIRNSIRVLTLTNEKFARLKAEELADDRFARKLGNEGLF